MAKRVLIVEDDADISELLTLLVEDAGGEALLAYAGDDAVERARLGVDLAIVDLGVPRLRGSALLTALAGIIPNLRLVVVSASRDAERVAHAHHIEYCFVKPFDVRALKSCLTALIAA